MSDSEHTETVEAEAVPRFGGGPLAAGTVVDGRYEVLGFLGRGGNASVYRARDRVLRVDVALKMLHAERHTATSLVRLRREVRVARDAASPRLVRIFDIGTAAEGTYVTMEVLQGSLRERLEQGGALPIDEAVRLMAGVLEGLAALHALNIVHRDVKPANILLDAAGEAKLADFGLARELDRDETRATTDLGVLGTAAYVSPEQAMGEEVDARSDLYSAGLVLFELLAGRLPHGARSNLGAMIAQFHQKIPDLRRLRPAVPRWLGRLTARLLARRPADRYASAGQALADLRARRAPRPTRARALRTTAAAFGVAVAAAAIATGLVIGVRSLRPAAAAYSQLIAQPDGFAAIDRQGKILWALHGVERETVERTAMARLTPGGPRFIAAVLQRPGQWRPDQVSTLSYLDPATGRIVKQAQLPLASTVFPEDPQRFSNRQVMAIDLDGDGIDEILVTYGHVPEAPAYTVLYAPRYDRAKVVFFSRGGHRLEGAWDIDGDGRPELIFSGINNGYDWVNALAAVRLDPWLAEPNWELSNPAASPDSATVPEEERLLLWYVPLPRGRLRDTAVVTADTRSRTFAVHYSSERIYTVGFDGFPPQPPGRLPVAERERQRREAYRQLREADRLRALRSLPLAYDAALAAERAATAAQEDWIAEYSRRVAARVLAAENRIDEAEQRFAAIARTAEDASEVAYEAAVAFHLAGDLPRALVWYRRGLDSGARFAGGKSKHEFLKGEVLALLEQRNYAGALAAIDSFERALNPEPVYREFVRWRAGETPADISASVPPNGTDLHRYWALECRLASGAAALQVLGTVDSMLLEKPETRGELLSLKAELLARLGETKVAAATAVAADEVVEAESVVSIIARGHLDLVRERRRRLAGDGPSGA